MTDHEAPIGGGGFVRRADDERSTEFERKTKELEEFRAAGVLTNAELEEQKAKLRWNLP